MVFCVACGEPMEDSATQCSKCKLDLRKAGGAFVILSKVFKGNEAKLEKFLNLGEKKYDVLQDLFILMKTTSVEKMKEGVTAFIEEVTGQSKPTSKPVKTKKQSVDDEPDELDEPDEMDEPVDEPIVDEKVKKVKPSIEDTEDEDMWLSMDDEDYAKYG